MGKIARLCMLSVQRLGRLCVEKVRRMPDALVLFEWGGAVQEYCPLSKTDMEGEE